MLPRPSLGSWLLYGLGSEADNLPGFVSLGTQNDLPGKVPYSSSFLPTAYEGVAITDVDNPIDNLQMPVPSPVQAQRLAAIRRFSEIHRQGREDDSRLDARIAAFELAFRMQTQAPEAFDLSRESRAIHKMYGTDQKTTKDYAQQCLLARRLVERGVPFVTVNNTGWDKHLDLETYANRHPGDPRSASHALIPGLDKALSSLIGDLSDRGMLDETLVVVMTDFGRTLKINSTLGRDHCPNCFSVAMAGGGVTGGQVIGESDAMGEFVKDRPITPGDLSSTIYTLLGIDPEHELHTPDGRPIRVAPQESKVIKELLGCRLV